LRSVINLVLGVITWQVIAPLLAFGFIGHSLWNLYNGAFPNLKSGNSSLIYFTEIAKRTEAKFIDEFTAQSEPEESLRVQQERAGKSVSKANRMAGVDSFCGR
jgi:hypothetical protein